LALVKVWIALLHPPNIERAIFMGREGINNKLASLLSCCPSHRPLHFFERSDAIAEMLEYSQTYSFLPAHGLSIALL